MFEIALNKNYANLAKMALNYCHILDKRILPGSNPIIQFTEDCNIGKLTNPNEKVARHGFMRNEIAHRIEQFRITLDRLYQGDYIEAKQRSVLFVNGL